MAELYLLLGGNLGDKSRIFTEARKLLRSLVGEITALSGIYETEPWGFESDDLFWNQAIKLSTPLSPEEVLAATQSTELALGRIRKETQYISRPIDIDILFFDDRIVKSDKLIIPHPRIQERRFVLVPLAEIAPSLQHPVLRKSMSELLAECPDLLKVTRL